VLRGGAVREGCAAAGVDGSQADNSAPESGAVCGGPGYNDPMLSPSLWSRVVLAVIALSAGGCCSGPDSIRITLTAPGNASDEVTWRDGIVLPPGFDIVVEYSDGDVLVGEAIEVYREQDGARVDATTVTTRGVEHDGECPRTHTVYGLRELDNGDHVAVHRRAAGTGKPVDQDDMPPWSTFEGEDALLFTFCIWDNSGMLSPCGAPGVADMPAVGRSLEPSGSRM
jgi:hypothetical protein